MAELTASMVRELKMQKDYLCGERINTIYFGGGTPSLLPAQFMEKLMQTIYKHFNVHVSCEITLEANPDDISKMYTGFLETVGINRISLGVQSFQDDELRFLNRIHNAKSAHKAIQLLHEKDISNISVDFIYGIPGQTKTSIRSTVEKFLEYRIPHISAYALTVEENTTLYKLIQMNKVPDVEESHQREHFELVRQLLLDHEYQHYEISNYSLEGKISRHNSNYWRQLPYLGIGPSAHSYDLKSRQWNISDIRRYMLAINAKKEWYEKEVLNEKQIFNEYLLTRLRTCWGVDLNEISQRFPEHFLKHLKKTMKGGLDRKMLILKNDVLSLSEQGMHYADGISSDLFYL